MATRTKKELVDRVADLTGNRRIVVKTVIQTFLDQIIDELAKGNRLEFRETFCFRPQDNDECQDESFFHIPFRAEE